LEQCLNSVFRTKGIESFEVIVVDNRSSDNSVSMVRQKFPQVLLIANEKNLGFSKANNQGIEISKGEFVVLLNPDTVVEESSFEKTLAAFQGDAKIGGIGVRMVDGKGKFLPESKRGLPTPWVAFYKVFGLAALFPSSRRFGKYHLSYLSPNENHDVDVLSGAYMGLRKSALTQTGLLDETFFMYGEDIDLSYRIQKAGYKNRYVSETTIIHYKGESTKKSSVNYVLVFYKAMIIFARKHFSQNNAFFFSFFIYAGIIVRACAALIRRFVEIVLPPVLSSAISLAGLYAFKYAWQLNDISFPKSAFYWMIPMYWMIWTSSNLLGGTYDPPFRPVKVFKSTFFATLIILVIYALLPKTLQFSRLYIVLGSFWFMFWILLDRLVRYWLLRESNGWNPRGKTRFLIVADKEEFSRIKTMILQQWSEVEYIHGAHLKEPYLESKEHGNTMIDGGNLANYDEIIFSAKDLSARTIILWMTSLVRTNVDFKIAQPETDFIIGSNSIDKPGEFYKININNLSRPENLRSKRFLDIITCLLLILSLWAIIWFYRDKKGLIRNIYQVLISQKTWVGFFPSSSQYADPQLPKIKTGVLPPSVKHASVSDELKDKLNLIYARDYSVSHDIKLILASLFHLDRTENSR
jgi:GT2 family glycosyltransferase